MRTRKRQLLGIATAVALCLPLAACGSGSSSSSKTVTIWTSMDKPVVAGLKKQLDPEAKKEGITVKWSIVTNINQLIITKLKANSAPNIAFIPQPGVVDQIVSMGKAYPLNNVLNVPQLTSDMVAGTVSAGEVNGKLYGLLGSMNVKSIVYYNKKAWATSGYKIPTSLEELNALTNQMRKDGKTPWCIGIGSDAATGWPVTDWIEDLILRYNGPEVYDKWVAGKVKFSDPQLRKAFNEFASIAFTKGNTPGGQKSLASVNFQDASKPMWNTKPGCWMLKQGNFITAFFPTDVQKNINEDVGTFYFPAATAGGQKPVLGGGDLATMLSNNDSTKKVMKLIANKNFGEKAAPTSSYISPFKTFNTSLYPNDAQKSAAEIAYAADVFRFDGSDAMPAKVGSGTFWTEMTSWVSGQTTLDKALKAIDASWPKSGS